MEGNVDQPGSQTESSNVDPKYALLLRKMEEYKKQSSLATKKNRKVEKQRKLASRELFKHEVYAKFYDQDESQATMQLDESGAALNYINKKMNQKMFAYKTKHEAMKNLESTIEQSLSEVTGRIKQLNKAVYEWQAANVIAVKQSQLANNNVIEKFHNWYQSAPLLHGWIQNEGKAHNAIYGSAMFHGMQQELEAMNELKQQLQEFWNSHYAELLQEQPKLMPLKQVHDQRQLRSDAFDQYHWKLIKQIRMSVRQCDNLQFEIEERERTRMKLLNITMEINHLINEQCKEAISFSEIESKRSIEQILFYLQGQNEETRQYMMENLNSQCDLLGMDMFTSSWNDMNDGGVIAKGYSGFLNNKFPEDLSTISTLSGSALGSQTVAEVNEKTIQEILVLFQNHFYSEPTENSLASMSIGGGIPSPVTTAVGNTSTKNIIGTENMSQKLLGANSLVTGAGGGNINHHQSPFPNTQSQVVQLRQIQHTKDVITRYCERILPHLKAYYQLLQYYPSELKLPPPSVSAQIRTTHTINEETTSSDYYSPSKVDGNSNQHQQEASLKKHPIFQVVDALSTIESMKHACHTISFDTISVLKKLLKTIEQVEGDDEEEEEDRVSPTAEPATSSSPMDGFLSPGTVNSYGYNMTPNTVNTTAESFSKSGTTAYEKQQQHHQHHQKSKKKRPEEMYLTAQELIHRVDVMFSHQRTGVEAWMIQGATNEFQNGKDKVDSYFIDFNEQYPNILDMKGVGTRKNHNHEDGDDLRGGQHTQQQPVESKDAEPFEFKKVNRLLEIALQKPRPATLSSVKGGDGESNDVTESSVQGLLSFSENLLNKIRHDLDKDVL